MGGQPSDAATTGHTGDSSGHRKLLLTMSKWGKVPKTGNGRGRGVGGQGRGEDTAGEWGLGPQWEERLLTPSTLFRSVREGPGPDHTLGGLQCSWRYPQTKL